MSFLSRFHNPTSAFPSDTFRLLDELNRVSSLMDAPRGGNKRAFSPNFDIHETDSAYVLEGEFPGLGDKSKINIEFTDDNTLLVRGKIEKSVHKTLPDSEPRAFEGPAPEGADTNTEVQVVKRIEDSQKSMAKPAGGYRCWVSERTVGEFQRSFSLPGAVDIDGVKASLENGLLKIVVPKREVVKGKKIEIF